MTPKCAVGQKLPLTTVRFRASTAASPQQNLRSMNAGNLFQARQLWMFLLRSGTPCEHSRWQAWADAQTRAITAEVPPWLLALSIAGTRDGAIRALEEDLALESAAFPGQIFERDALTIGFVFARHAEGELSREQMWTELRRLVDVAEFLDGGEWRRWQGIHAGDSEDPLAEDAGWIRHLAWLAVHKENELLRGEHERRPEPRRTA